MSQVSPLHFWNPRSGVLGGFLGGWLIAWLIVLVMAIKDLL